MSNNKKDQPNTKTLLLKAFEKYLTEQVVSLDSLSVGKLSTLAKIHRVTFYHHFLSMNDFIKWYLHKDLIFQLKADDVLNIEASLKSVFDFVNKNRKILQRIMDSSYGLDAQVFIANEAMTYQLTNMKRIDVLKQLSNVERRIYARFYSQAIQHMIFDYIGDSVIQTLAVDEYLSYCVLLIKNYIEKLLEGKQQLI
jgi:AcrR family transcriptional regulator